MCKFTFVQYYAVSDKCDEISALIEIRVNARYVHVHRAARLRVSITTDNSRAGET